MATGDSNETTRRPTPTPTSSNLLGAREAGGLRILLADDDEACLSTVESFLAGDGHTIYVARHGLEALERARMLKRELLDLDLSILDFHMPGFTGIETLRKLAVEFPGIGAIIVSGDASTDLSLEVGRLGGSFLRKPLDVGLLRRAIRDLGWRRRWGPVAPEVN